MRSRAALLALVSVLALSSCASSTGGGAPGGRPQCVPDVVAVSRVIAQPGTELHVSAQAAPCAVEFTAADRVLTVAMKPLHGDRTASLPLTTVQAAPSGAFRATVRVPEQALSGDWVVLVSDGLAATACDDTGGGLASCAAPEAYLHVARLTPDWTRGTAKRQAAAVANRIEEGLAGSAGFLGVEVLPGGVQVSLAHPFRDHADRVIAAAGGGQPSSSGRLPEGRVPVVRFNGFTNRAELLDLLARVERARPALLQQGIRIDDVEPDFMTSTVVARVDDGTDAAARVLSRRFGTALVIEPVD